MTSTTLPTFEDRKTARYRSPVPASSIVTISSHEAKWILAEHNAKNRSLKQQNLRQIRTNVSDHGWVFNGDPIAFYTDGNLCSGQHRLTVLADCNTEESASFVMVLGVNPDAFAICGNNKRRGEQEEIERFDKTATYAEVAAVGDLCRRRKDLRWDLGNCVAAWQRWKGHVRTATPYCEELEEIGKFSSQQKTIRGFVALCIAQCWGEEAAQLIQLLCDEITGRDSTRLAASFMDSWNQIAGDLDNEKRMQLLFRMLCQALNRLRQSPEGLVELSLNPLQPDLVETKLLAIS